MQIKPASHRGPAQRLSFTPETWVENVTGSRHYHCRLFLQRTTSPPHDLVRRCEERYLCSVPAVDRAVCLQFGHDRPASPAACYPRAKHAGGRAAACQSDSDFPPLRNHRSKPYLKKGLLDGTRNFGQSCRTSIALITRFSKRRVVKKNMTMAAAAALGSIRTARGLQAEAAPRSLRAELTQGTSNVRFSRVGFWNNATQGISRRMICNVSYKVELVSPAGTFVLEVPEDVYILDAAEKQDIELPYACRAGACSSCADRISLSKRTRRPNFTSVRGHRAARTKKHPCPHAE
ncbi:hypothetical protein R1flu_024177 [Riccia fluitans]|uniref:2Fe-2S ferredoxin-type domain-containing protein n=1 Tax=Riccia fluitans TaxID=41844 RepID=A0ABD1XU49_9MARC